MRNKKEDLGGGDELRGLTPAQEAEAEHRGLDFLTKIVRLPGVRIRRALELAQCCQGLPGLRLSAAGGVFSRALRIGTPQSAISHSLPYAGGAGGAPHYPNPREFATVSRYRLRENPNRIGGKHPN